MMPKRRREDKCQIWQSIFLDVEPFECHHNALISLRQWPAAEIELKDTLKARSILLDNSICYADSPIRRYIEIDSESRHTREPQCAGPTAAIFRKVLKISVQIIQRQRERPVVRIEIDAINFGVVQTTQIAKE